MCGACRDNNIIENLFYEWEDYMLGFSFTHMGRLHARNIACNLPIHRITLEHCGIMPCHIVWCMQG